MRGLVIAMRLTEPKKILVCVCVLCVCTVLMFTCHDLTGKHEVYFEGTDFHHHIYWHKNDTVTIIIAIGFNRLN